MSYSFLLISSTPPLFFFFFFNDTATTEIYTLSLHDALPICSTSVFGYHMAHPYLLPDCMCYHSRSASPSGCSMQLDRKSTRLNSSHLGISYAVFCLKKKKKPTLTYRNCNTSLIKAMKSGHKK